MEIKETTLYKFLIEQNWNGLTLPYESTMASRIRRWTERKKSSVLVNYIRIDNEIIGWVWALHRRFWSSRYIEFQIYVKPEYRRRGYGSILIDSIKDRTRKHKRKYLIHPWDEQSKSFFSTLRFKAHEPLR